MLDTYLDDESANKQRDALIKALIAAAQNCIYAINGQCWLNCLARDLCPESYRGELVGDLK